MQTTADLAVTTSREDFRALAAEHRVVPVTRKVLADSETPLSAYRKLAANRPGTFLLESAENGRSWSRWSFIGAGAPSALTVRDGEAAWLGVTPQDAPSGGDPLRALRETLELLRDRASARAAAAVRRTRRLLRLRPGAPARAAARAGGRRPGAARHAAAAGHRHRRRRPPRGHHHADRQRGELERHRRARRLGLRRRRRPARRDDRGAWHEPLSSTVATFSRPEPRHRQQRTVEEYSAIVEQPRRRDRGGRGVPGGAVAALRDGHRRRPARRVPDAAGVQPQPVHVSAERARMPMADWTSRSSGPARRRW